MPKGKSNRKYAGDFKQKAIEDMRQNGLSLGETARKYKIVLSMVQRWERIYLEEGPQGLYIERRGRACSDSGANRGRPPKFEKTVEEDLIAENQHLRMENDYLKKLNALVREQTQPKNKKLK